MLTCVKLHFTMESQLSEENTVITLGDWQLLVSSTPGRKTCVFSASTALKPLKLIIPSTRFNCPFVVERLIGEEKPLEMNKDREQLWKMLIEFDYESRNYHRLDNKGRHTFDRL